MSGQWLSSVDLPESQGQFSPTGGKQASEESEAQRLANHAVLPRVAPELSLLSVTTQRTQLASIRSTPRGEAVQAVRPLHRTF